MLDLKHLKQVKRKQKLKQKQTDYLCFECIEK